MSDIKHYVLPVPARRPAERPGYIKQAVALFKKAPACHCRGAKRAAQRRMDRAMKKAMEATSDQGRAMAARDMALAKEWL